MLRSRRRFADTPVETLTRVQLAARAQALRDHRRILEALELVRDWEDARKGRRA